MDVWHFYCVSKDQDDEKIITSIGTFLYFWNLKIDNNARYCEGLII